MIASATISSRTTSWGTILPRRSLTSKNWLGVESTRPMVEGAQREIAGPFHFFDAIYCINLDADTERWRRVTKSFEQLGIARRVQRFPAIETPSNHHIGCALSHRAIIAEAKKYGFANVLVFEDECRIRQ
jgi:hypothetical protein